MYRELELSDPKNKLSKLEMIPEEFAYRKRKHFKTLDDVTCFSGRTGRRCLTKSFYFREGVCSAHPDPNKARSRDGMHLYIDILRARGLGIYKFIVIYKRILVHPIPLRDSYS
jgi:hypothetical protein